MAIDIFFNRHWKKDFFKVEKGLMGILGDEKGTLVLEGNQIPVSKKVLLTNDFSTFNKLYEQDLLEKKIMVENPELSYEVLKLTEHDEELIDNYSLNEELYKLAFEKKLLIKHEITPPDLLFMIQQTYCSWSMLPFCHTDGASDEYIASMRSVIKAHIELTYARDKIFLEQMKEFESEGDRRIVSTRGSVHSYMTQMAGIQGVNFHGNLNPVFDDIQTTLFHNSLKSLKISDDDLVKVYQEIKTPEQEIITF